MIITMTQHSSDFKLFKKVINQGIDSHLEGFTKSKFSYNKEEKRCFFDFHDSEISILVRRLKQINTYNSNLWVEDLSLIHI